ncbi:hypothetical protein B566_EDAN004425 [Ephemera danica]|nr:hypothetical protein B566_EDAN004425 [Ephemera danica]
MVLKFETCIKWHSEIFAMMLISCVFRHPETACFQLHAEDWSGCHRTLIQHLAADAIITRNTGLVMRLLKTLRPHGDQIENWEEHGEVLLTYLILLEDIRGLQLAGNEQGIGLSAPGNLEALKQRIRSTANKIMYILATV